MAKRAGRKTAGIISGAFVLLVVWLTTGIWHGANMTFAVWGLIQFVFILWEQYRKPLSNRKLGAALGFATTFLAVLATKVIFRAASLAHAGSYYASMLHLNGNAILDAMGVYWLKQLTALLFIGLLFAFPVVEKLGALVRGRGGVKLWDDARAVALVALLVLDICYAIGTGYNPFIYFNF